MGSDGVLRGLEGAGGGDDNLGSGILEDPRDLFAREGGGDEGRREPGGESAEGEGGEGEAVGDLYQDDGGDLGAGAGRRRGKDVDVVGVEAEGLESAGKGERVFLELAMGEGAAWKG